MNLNEYYGFVSNPFGKYIDMDNVYESNDYKQVYNRMRSVIDCEGIGPVTGKSGVGKTTIIKSFISRLSERYKIIYVQGAQMSIFDFYHTVCNQLDIKISDCHKIRMIEDIQRELVELKRNGIKVMVVLDDAQELPSAIIQELRVFYDYGLKEAASIALIIVAHTDFRHTLRKEKYEMLHNRIIANYDCAGLSYNEIKGYIENRLRSVDGNTNLFNERNYININSCADGNPRRLNTLMNNVLMVGYLDEKKVFDAQMIKRAKDEMEI